MSTFAHAQLPVADMDNHTHKVQVGDLVFPVFDQGEGEVVLLLHGFPDFSNTSSLPAVKADAMGIWSDGDIYLTEEHVTSSPEKLEGKWRYEKITGASHWLMLDKPNEVNKLLLEFLGNGR